MALSAYLAALAAQACAPWELKWYSIALANVNSQTKRLQPSEKDGPFVACGLMCPGAATYPATATLEIEQGGRNYTQGGVRASAVALVGAGAVSAAAALGAQDSWPAPIIVPRNGTLSNKLTMDAGGAGASTFLRYWGYHTSEDFAARLAELGELFVAQLQMADFTAGVLNDKDSIKLPGDVVVDKLWQEETAAGGALVRLELELDDESLIRDPENATALLAPYPQDPRAIVGYRFNAGQVLRVKGLADGGGTLTTRTIFRGSRVY